MKAKCIRVGSNISNMQVVRKRSFNSGFVPLTSVKRQPPLALVCDWAASVFVVYELDKLIRSNEAARTLKHEAVDEVAADEAGATSHQNALPLAVPQVPHAGKRAVA